MIGPEQHQMLEHRRLSEGGPAQRVSKVAVEHGADLRRTNGGIVLGMAVGIAPSCLVVAILAQCHRDGVTQIGCRQARQPVLGLQLRQRPTPSIHLDLLVPEATQAEAVEGVMDAEAHAGIIGPARLE